MVPSSGCCIFQSKVSLVQFLHKMNLLCLARMRERDSQCSSFSYKLSIEKKKLFNSSLLPFQFCSNSWTFQGFWVFLSLVLLIAWTCFFFLFSLFFSFYFLPFQICYFLFFPSCKFLSTFLILCDQFFCFVYSHELRKLNFYFPAQF